jgi:hypothetical protein
LEGWLAGLRVGDLGELGHERLEVGGIVASTGQLAEVELAARRECVRAGRPEVDVRKGAVLGGARQERDHVERAPVPGDGPHELLVHAREVVDPAVPPRLQRPTPEAEVAVLLQPAVEMEHPVERLHPVVGEDQDRRLLAVALGCGLDQLTAGRVDPFVDMDDLVAGLVRLVCRMLRIEAGVAEVADVVGAHEVDAEETELRLELEDELADPATSSTCSSSRSV